MVDLMKFSCCMVYVAIFCDLQVEPVPAQGITICMERNHSQSEGLRQVDCNSPFAKTVCLICNIHQSYRNLSWYYENSGTQLARDNLNLHSKHAGGMIVNGCRSQNYSLKLIQPPVNKTSYYCKRNDLTLLRFHVTVQAAPTLSINSSGMINGVSLLTYVGSSETLMCSIEGAVTPVNLAWSLNNITIKNQTFTGKLNTMTASFTFVVFKYLSEVTCSCEGPYIVDTYAKVLVHLLEDRAFKECDKLSFWDNVRGAASIIASLLIFIIVLICLVLYFKCKIHRGYSISKRNGTASENYEARITEDSGNIVHKAETTQHLDIAGDCQKSFNISLVTRLKKGGVFDYWSATYHLGSSNKGLCFVKRMPELSTDKERHLCETVLLKLKSLESSTYVVNIIYINLEEIPYYVCYEYMAYGTLKGFVLNNFEKVPEGVASNSTASIKQTKQLVTLASQVAGGMVFVTSQMFNHPMLSMRKVLITEDCNCKLYDIYPAETALVKIKSHIKKGTPSFAWMSPETMLYQQYLPQSDVWSYSVLLWELFSLGETPFASLEPSQIPQHIRSGGVLSKPQECPDFMYSIMMSSWNHNPRKRPSFQHLQKKLHSVMNAIDQETYDGRFYDTLIS